MEDEEEPVVVVDVEDEEVSYSITLRSAPFAFSRTLSAL